MSERDELLVRLTEALPRQVGVVPLVERVGDEDRLTPEGREVLTALLPAVASWSVDVYCRALAEAAAWLGKAGQSGGPPTMASNGGNLYADDGRWAPGVLLDLAARVAARSR